MIATGVIIVRATTREAEATIATTIPIAAAIAIIIDEGTMIAGGTGDTTTATVFIGRSITTGMNVVLTATG